MFAKLVGAQKNAKAEIDALFENISVTPVDTGVEFPTTFVQKVAVMFVPTAIAVVPVFM